MVESKRGVWSVLIAMMAFGEFVRFARSQGVSNRTVDIGVFVDQLFMGEPADRVNRTYPTCNVTATCNMSKWVTSIAAHLLQQQEYRIKIAVYSIFTIPSERMALWEGTDPAIILRKTGPLNSLFVHDYYHFRGIMQQRFPYVRRYHNLSKGNEPTAPDLIVWIAMYDPKMPNYDHKLMKDLRDFPDGPDVVIGRNTYAATAFKVTMVNRVDKDNVMTPTNEQEIAENILAVLSLCNDTAIKSQCYWIDSGQTQCKMDVTYSPHGQQEYCRPNRTETVEDCDGGLNRCHVLCHNATMVGMCDAPCDGHGNQTVQINTSDVYYQHCPTDPVTCTGPPCPTTPAPTETTPEAKSSQWQIGVIVVVVLIVLAIVIGLIVWYIRKRRNSAPKGDQAKDGKGEQASAKKTPVAKTPVAKTETKEPPPRVPSILLRSGGPQAQEKNQGAYEYLGGAGSTAIPPEAKSKRDGSKKREISRDG